jgi:hypothetical protein
MATDCDGRSGGDEQCRRYDERHPGAKQKAVALSDQRAEQGNAFSTLPSSVDVSGGTSKPRPPPIASSCALIAQ